MISSPRLIGLSLLFALAAPLAWAPVASSGEEPSSIPAAPERQEGEGPYEQLILRGLTLINSTGAPPIGPVDVVIEDERIVAVEVVGYPGVPVDAEDRPELAAGGREMDLTGHYVLPGFVDMHAHMGGVDQGTPAEYVFKLWMGHGITTIRDPACGNGLDFCLEHRARSAANRITAPRIRAYPAFGMGHEGPIRSADEARRWVREVARDGADGIKFFGAPPAILEAALDEAGERGLRTAMHHAQLDVARADVLDTARWGLTSMEHWYGLPEALFTDRTVQDYPVGYNYQDEAHRFGEAGRLWRQAAEPGSERWVAVRDELVALDFTLDPTFTIYEASRDLMSARRAEWHEEYTLPSLWDFFEPSRKAHGSYWFHWTSADEIAWRDNFWRWMGFVDDFKDHGGRVTVGSDSGYIYKIYGFGYIEELELLQEAGFHPLEVIRSATLNGAEALGLDSEIGSVEVGKKADLVIVAENPLADFKTLFGTGAIRLDADDEPIRVGGVKYTIKDGIIYDAAQLRADVREMVEAAKTEAGIQELKQPGR